MHVAILHNQKDLLTPPPPPHPPPTDHKVFKYILISVVVFFFFSFFELVNVNSNNKITRNVFGAKLLLQQIGYINYSSNIINYDCLCTVLSLLHTSDVSAIASARTFTLEHKRRKRGGLYLALTIALTFCRFTLEDF